MLEVALDKADYAAGEAMTLNIRPRFAGRATVAIIGDKAQLWREIDLPAGGTQLRLQASGEWGPGAYAVVMAHRPLDQAARRMPGRALGVAWFSVEKAARALPVSLDLPARIRPRATLDIPVAIAAAPAGEEAFVTVSAVDVGIPST